ncbi:MAG: radical SAM protein [Planctomycetes bacterium]|nr:radical SAM protein [Planctomycetota bacterium]
MHNRRRERRRFGNVGRWAKTYETATAFRNEGAGQDSSLRIVLWDTRHGGAFKDFAGGYGVGQFRGQGLRSKIIEYFYRTDFRSPPLAYGYLAAGLTKLGHQVKYCLEDMPEADVYIFNPALMTVPYEIEAIRRLNETFPHAKALVVGTAASTMSDAFAGLNCHVLQGEPEQLLAKLDDVLASRDAQIPIGTVADLDALPFPDWSAFPYWQFRVGYDFWKFPTAYIQSSRGCTLSCSYCPYIILENKVRTRSPEQVVAEMRHDIEEYGFQSFKFRDPLFGVKRKHMEELAERIGKMPHKTQFSVESRIELLSRDVLKMLREVGLTSVTVGIETPSRDTLVKYKRAPIKDDKQSEFVSMCRSLGIRVVAGFMIGFPEDTRESIRAVLRYAKQVDPFAANFNVCTPYPGTDFIKEIDSKIANRDWSRYNVYTPNLKYDHLTTEEVAELHQVCFRQFYFRWKYLQDNWQFHFPRLHQIVSKFTGKAPEVVAEPAVAGPLKVVSAPDDSTTCGPKLVQIETDKNSRRSA